MCNFAAKNCKVQRAVRIRWAFALLALLWVADACQPASAGTNDNPYRAISERNAFGLKPPAPPPVEIDDPPAPPAIDIKLTGICSVLATKKVLLQVLESGVTQPRFYNLAEGESAAGLQIVKIDEEAETVRVRLRGETILLTFKTHGLKSPGAGPSAPRPVEPPAHGSAPPPLLPPAAPNP